MTKQDLQGIADAIGPILADLHKRLAVLENREYKGIWDASTPYTKGMWVTYGGSVWHANEASTGIRPGEAAPASRVWRLAIKAGRDGRDLR